MEEEHIFSSNELTSEENPKKNGVSGVNKVLMGIVVVLLLVITGGGAYFLGTKKSSGDEKPTPTQSPFKTETLGEETEITPTLSPTATVSATVTPKVTPSVTPKVTAIPTFKLMPSIKPELIIKITNTPTPTTVKINPDVL